MPNILVTLGDAFARKAKEIIEEIGDVKYVDSLQGDLTNVTVLLVGLSARIDGDVMDRAPNLKVVATPATGLDHIDLAQLKRRGVAVLSLKGEKRFLDSITATAELACGLMLALARNIVAAHTSVVSGRWDRKAFQGSSLCRKTLGIIGYGRLGRMMARYGEALGMTVIFADPDVEEGVGLEELLEKSDVVSIHVHLTEETAGIIGEDSLRHMKPSALLINTSRGKIVDEGALVAALEAGEIAGYATDVLADELSFEGRANAKLIDHATNHTNVIITPHIGGMTREAREATDVLIAEKVRTALSEP